eukprot:3912716-Pleurochrysis_carterae.AAC.1
MPAAAGPRPPPAPHPHPPPSRGIRESRRLIPAAYELREEGEHHPVVALPPPRLLRVNKGSPAGEDEEVAPPSQRCRQSLHVPEL